MFNCYFELNEENFDILFVNAIIENLKYGIISLDAMFLGKITDEYYYDEHTFYFYHMQSVLTAQGNIWNVLYNDYHKRNRAISEERVKKMRQRLGIDPKDYPLVGNKAFRNTNEHFDERYFSFVKCAGDYNILKKDTPPEIKEAILATKHLRTIDIVNWKYITYTKNQKQISLDLQELRQEMYIMFYNISTCDLMKKYDTYNPRNNILKTESNKN